MALKNGKKNLGQIQVKFKRHTKRDIRDPKHEN